MYQVSVASLWAVTATVAEQNRMRSRWTIEMRETDAGLWVPLLLLVDTNRMRIAVLVHHLESGPLLMSILWSDFYDCRSAQSQLDNWTNNTSETHR